MSTRSRRGRAALAAVQRQFQQYVLQRAPAVLERVLATGAADATARMDVYAEGYPLRLLEALQADYPGLAALAGAEAFDAFGRAFIVTHPSRVRNLRWYGEALASFLATTAPWHERQELADMARFEWAMATAFDAPDAACLTREALAGVAPGDWPRLRLNVHPAVQRIDLRSDVPAAWAAQSRGEPVPVVRRGDQPTAWLLTRRELQVRFRPMTQPEAGAFDLLAGGAAFESWCAGLGAALGEQRAAAQRAVEFINQWLADGALAGFTLEAVEADQ